MSRDSDPRKWEYPEHTRVKHELLEKYLGGWLPILGRWHERLIIVDGFAGRGEYTDGSDGSPVILLRKAQELIDAGRVQQVFCAFVERDTANVSNLQTVLDTVAPSYPDVRVLGPYGYDFEAVAQAIIDQTGGNLVPSFWFVDPFGFTGMSFDTVSKIMSLSRSEVFITLMLRDIGRFLTRPGLEEAFDRLFGTEEWRSIVRSNQEGRAKELALRDLYIGQLRSIGCKVTTFRVSMDERLQTVYYMVHGTKHCKGRWLMKDVMAKQGPSGVFAYLGPGDSAARIQGTLFPAGDLAMLKAQLAGTFAGRTVAFDALLEECCDDNELRVPDYRSALQELRKEGMVMVAPVSSKTDRGLKGKDRITFPAN